MKISVAIPCYKSEKSIKKVVNDVISAIKEREGNDYQIILVNDYPDDNTFSIIKELCYNDKKIIGVNLSKNFGQTAAKLAAVQYFTGDVLVYMDDDGQHPAELIYQLVDKIEEGYDAVYAYFPHKKHNLFKRATSSLNGKIEELNGTKPKGVYITSYYALNKFAVESFKDYNSPFPSLDGFLNSFTGKIINVEMPHHDRMYGRSNYSLGKLIKMWITQITNFSIVPLRIVSVIGFIMALFGFLFGLYIVIRKLVSSDIDAGYTSTIALLLLIGGLILFALGFIGEYIGRIYMTVSNLSPYKVKEVINADNVKEN